jgi:hypothetical protein
MFSAYQRYLATTAPIAAALVVCFDLHGRGAAW